MTRSNPDQRLSRRVRALCMGGAAAPWAVVFIASAQLGSGFDELNARLGSAAPTGAGIGLGMGEALEGSNYAPNYPVTLMSGPSGASGHATNVLNTFRARAPGATQVWSWEALDYLQGGFLRFGGPAPALPPSGLKVFNHSWIASGEDAASGNDVIRRFDWQVNRDQTFNCVGATNGTPYLMGGNYNGISVGDSGGASALTPGGGRDGAGRMKPDLADFDVESGTTPRVAAAGALLLETAATDPGLAANPDADLAVVIKATLLAGADHISGSDPNPWTNNPSTSGATRGRTSTPYDARFGAGFLNVNSAHLIFTAGEVNSSSTVPVDPTIGPRGWGFTSISSNTRRYWRFSVAETADEVTIVATWPRIVNSTFTSWSLMNIDLTLHRVADGSTTLLPLTGDAGVPYFASGNVVSESDVDNVELLVVRGLEPGEYVIEIFRETGATSTGVAVAWIMPEPKPQPCVGDLDQNGEVSGSDLGLLLADWGEIDSPADLNDSGLVDGADLTILLNAWGLCP